MSILLVYSTARTSHPITDMPLSNNDQVNEVASALNSEMRSFFKGGAAYRPAHAKGLLVSGSWTPTEEAKTLSRAQHFHNSTSVSVRFSSSTGLPQIPDTDPNSNPRGLAIRFNLGDRKHTDIVSHSTPFFPVNNGADFLALFKAITGGTAGEFLSSHPAALAFVQAPKPFAKSYVTEQYYGLNAFKLVSSDGKETFVRYRFVPDAGVDYFNDTEVKSKSAHFLHDELRQRLKSGPASFSLVAQVAAEDDVTNDITVKWSEDRKLVKLGTIKLEKVIEESADLQRTIIFDPIPRVDGVEPSDDPILDFRASLYLISGRERRGAGGYDPEKLPKIDAVPEAAKIVT